jgi:hypothetical protein
MYAWGVLIETMTSLINCGTKNAQAGSGERKEEGIEAVVRRRVRMTGTREPKDVTRDGTRLQPGIVYELADLVHDLGLVSQRDIVESRRTQDDARACKCESKMGGEEAKRVARDHMLSPTSNKYIRPVCTYAT